MLSNLLPNHEKLIRASAISDEVADARGYRSVTSKVELKSLGFSDAQCIVPTLLNPIHGVGGEVVSYQSRPDIPRLNKSGKPVKYETPSGSTMVIDVPTGVLSSIDDPNIPLFITEGIRKADSAVSHGLCCIALLGVWNWRGKNNSGGKIALPDWEYIALNDRSVYICFDSDVMRKPEVHKAMSRLKAFLELRGAHVSLIYLPEGEDAKTGLDDYLAAGNDVSSLFELADSQVHCISSVPACPYFSDSSGMFWRRETSDGVTSIQLTNFAARIVGETIQDDGVETHRLFEIEAEMSGKKFSISIPATSFPGLSWVLESLGANAIVNPGSTTKDHARTAIQRLSGDIQSHLVFAHTGWRKVNGEWLYLHKGGAIGKNGSVDDIKVELPTAVSGYELPDPIIGEPLQQAIRDSLRILELSTDEIMIPLYAAIWVAPVVNIDFSIHLSGPTGSGKSEIAALIQQHWGKNMAARNLPGSWSSTANALTESAFFAKDAVFVIDDFAPTGTSADIARMNREADRILRAQGNSSGRQRMRADCSLRPSKPPRGLILSTGEDLPRGESLRARLVTLETSPDKLNWDLLTVLQQLAASGQFAAAMSGYVKWLAGRYEELLQARLSSICELRSALTTAQGHKRTPGNMAALAFGFRLFLDYSSDIGAITQEQYDNLWARALYAVNNAAMNQSQHSEAYEPARRFIESIRSALTSGMAHVTGQNGAYPPNPIMWGWQKLGPDWEPKGDCIGWYDGGDLLLEPEASYSIAQRHAQRCAETLIVSMRTLHKRLHQQGCLASIEESRKTLLVRRTLDGSRRNVLHIRKDRILPDEADQTDQTDILTGKCDPESHSIGQVSENVKNRPAGKTDQTDPADYAEVHTNDGEMVTSVGLVSKQKHMPDPTDWGIAI